MQKEYEDRIRKDIGDLGNAANEAYKSRQYDKGALLFGKALKLSKELDDTKLIVRYHLWKGACYVENNKYKRAIAEFTQALSLDISTANDADVFNIMTAFVDVGLSIPTRLEAINKSLKQCSDFIKTKETYWKATYLYIVSDLANLRGDKDKANELIQEAFSVWEKKYSHYIADEYLWRLTKYAIEQKKFAIADEYLAKWDNYKNDFHISRKRYKAKINIELNRAKLKKQKALKVARNFAPFDTDEPDYLITAYLINNEWKPAKEAVIRYICKKRSSESLYTQSSCFTFLGDYHYVVARALLGLPPVDFKYDKPKAFEIIDKITVENDTVKRKRSFKDKLFGQADVQISLKEIKKHLKNAEWAYLRAFEISKEIDQRLECLVNTTETRTRLEYLYKFFDIILGYVPKRDLDFFPERKESINNKQI